MNIGRYEIQGELGKGGMGTVLLGWDPVLKRKVAIKCVRTDLVADDAERRAIESRLFREAEASARLRHQGIVAIYDIVQTYSGAFIVMEFVPGRMLSQMTTAGQPADTTLTARIIAETADALDHAHLRAIIHRDIKPSNIMVDDTGAIRITDFGIAKIVGAQTQTGPGLAIGTLEYMSPEQLAASTLDGRTDQFSLAVVAFRLLTGRPMYDAPTTRRLVLKIATEAPPPASSINPTLPRAVDAVLAKALEKNREDRYGTCSEFAAALGAALVRRVDAHRSSRPTTLQVPAIQPVEAPPLDSRSPSHSVRGREPSIAFLPPGMIISASWILAGVVLLLMLVFFTR